MDYVDFFKWQLSLGKNSRFLPKVNFSKREGVFTLYYYPSKDSLICRYRFFYDGGEVLPVIGKWEEGNVDRDGGASPIDIPAFISRYFSFNITNLRKAIHRRGMSKTNSSSSRGVTLYPRIALINKDFFGQKQSRSRKADGVIKKNSIDWHSFLKDLVKEKVDLYQLLLWSASNYDFSRFDEFEVRVKQCGGKAANIPLRSLFSFFKNFILDLQSQLC